MKRGNLVIKTSGMDQGKTGIVLDLINYQCTSEGHKIIKVMTSECKIKNWAAHLVDVISEK